MREEEKIKVGISIGDLNGIGGEIIIKTFEDSRILDFCTPIIFASIKTMSFQKKHFGSNINFNSINKVSQSLDNRVNILNVWNEDVRIEFGAEDPKIGEYAIKSLVAATQSLKKSEIDVLVTAPINKHNIHIQEKINRFFEVNSP